MSRDWATAAAVVLGALIGAAISHPSLGGGYPSPTQAAPSAAIPMVVSVDANPQLTLIAPPTGRAIDRAAEAAQLVESQRVTSQLTAPSAAAAQWSTTSGRH
jgi:hypothetical protein